MDSDAIELGWLDEWAKNLEYVFDVNPRGYVSGPTIELRNSRMQSLWKLFVVRCHLTLACDKGDLSNTSYTLRVAKKNVTRELSKDLEMREQMTSPVNPDVGAQVLELKSRQV